MKNRVGKAAFTLAKTPLGDLIVGIAFGKFAGALPIKKIVETNKVIAFWHPKPYYEKHILIVLKVRIKSLMATDAVPILHSIGIFDVVQKVVKKLKWQDKGYSLTVNGGKRQEINQLHFHLHSGKILDHP